MSHYKLDELVSLWNREKLSPEQMIGQILLLLVTIHQRLSRLEKQKRQDS